MTPTSPQPNRSHQHSTTHHHHSHHHPHSHHPGNTELTTTAMVSPKNTRGIHTTTKTMTKSSSLPAPPSLLGPLEDIFQLLQEVFHSRKLSFSLSMGVVRALFTIYQNLKVIRVHAIVQCQFTNDLKIRLVDLKRQLEAARNHDCLLSSPPPLLPEVAQRDQDAVTATPEPTLKKIFPVLEQTEQIVSTLHKFLVSKPRLRLTIPPAIWALLQRMPADLVQFPDHLARQLSECKTSLQRIVVLYNQLSEAHKTLGSGGGDGKCGHRPLLTSSIPQSSSSSSSFQRPEPLPTTSSKVHGITSCDHTMNHKSAAAGTAKDSTSTTRRNE